MGGRFAPRRLTPRWPTPIYLDASIQKRVRTALAIVRTDILHPDMPNCPTNVGDRDETWLPIVGRNDWLAIMRDQRIETRARERQALLDNRVRAFVLTGAGELKVWESWLS